MVCTKKGRYLNHRTTEAAWRSPLQVVSQWADAHVIDPALFTYKTKGPWWDILETLQITLLVTREYEHLVMALCAQDHRISFWPIPHPSGLVVDRAQNAVYLASTRNPNQIFDLVPMSGMLARPEMRYSSVEASYLMPIRSRFLPGCLYLHDLAVIQENLYANAVGQNAIVRIDRDGRFERVWWPKCIETKTAPVFERNHIQLNSIAPGSDIAHSYFTASAHKLSFRRPGHRNFPVNGKGVVFSGATREPIAFGLTRPHSARLYQNRLWVNNSGYGEIGFCEDGRFTPTVRFAGWTRGLCFKDGIAFVGTSRVIPRFRHYAPGLDHRKSECGIHAVDVVSGTHLASLIWPRGNQIFAIDWMDRAATVGFASPACRRRSLQREKDIYYGFRI